ncbi:MAG: RHS repeat-associated core domain-containing protein [Deltaproteobacteria bacterium]|nr:RHS repeat-associated core domain-containing protein [Deltaproteobacteria bacterium]
MIRWSFIFALCFSMAHAEVIYFHSDRLGSTAVVSDSSGAVQQIECYTPFGEIVTPHPFGGEGATPYLYTNQELDRASELYYYGARFYDATLNRFLSVDTYFDGLNPYSYVHNNPILLTDPTGSTSKCSGFFSCFDLGAQEQADSPGFGPGNPVDMNEDLPGRIGYALGSALFFGQKLLTRNPEGKGVPAIPVGGPTSSGITWGGGPTAGAVVTTAQTLGFIGFTSGATTDPLRSTSYATSEGSEGSGNQESRPKIYTSLGKSERLRFWDPVEPVQGAQDIQGEGKFVVTQDPETGQLALYLGRGKDVYHNFLAPREANIIDAGMYRLLPEGEVQLFDVSGRYGYSTQRGEISEALGRSLDITFTSE